MTRLLARLRARWRAFRRAPELDAEMHEEMRFHVEMEADRLVRDERLDRQEARRRARVAFGGVEKYKEQGRAIRPLGWIDAMALDGRLGVRMLAKHKGLTLAGGFAMAVAIAIGATFVEVVNETLDPALPFENGGRIVALAYETAAGVDRPAMHEFTAWRDGLSTVGQVSAFRTAAHNLVSAPAPPEPIKVAEISASAFALVRVPPLAGRYLLPADERGDAPPVVVIGHQPWVSRFGGDPQIVGRAITLGGVPRTVVGIMPDGFRFPVDHHFWIPLHVNPVRADRSGPELYVFGLLAPGATPEIAQAELGAVGRRPLQPGQKPAEEARPVVMPFTREHVDLTEPGMVWLLRTAEVLVGAVCLVVAINLAILVYARTVTRHGEIAVRTALGATRRRILIQLFIEALALSGLGAAVGLALSAIALARLQSIARFNGSVPFWIAFDLSPATMLYALGLAIVAAAIMGVLPGLKTTAAKLTAGLRELGAAATRLGKVWTTLVVAQVGAAVAVLPISVYLAAMVVQLEVAGPGVAAEEFVVATVASSETAVADASLVRRRQLDLMARLKEEPGVAGVTFSTSVPGLGPGRVIEIEHDQTARRAPLVVSRFDVDVGLFSLYRARILGGRTFDAGDLGSGRAVVVNRSFVEAFLPDRNALGARVRYAGARPDPQWYDIVGVVDDFPDFPSVLSLDTRPNLYHPAAAGHTPSYILSVRFAGPLPPGLVGRFRAIGAEVDPALQVRRVMPLAEFYGQMRSFWRYLAWGVGLLTASVLLLSAAGIYAMMSFTVAQRAREIGIRTALGAGSRRILVSIFGWASGQLGLGLLAGSLLSGGVLWAADVGLRLAAPLLATVAAILLVVGLLAALGPARRCLRVQLSDVLKADT